MLQKWVSKQDFKKLMSQSFRGVTGQKFTVVASFLRFQRKFQVNHFDEAKQKERPWTTVVCLTADQTFTKRTVSRILLLPCTGNSLFLSKPEKGDQSFRNSKHRTRAMHELILGAAQKSHFGCWKLSGSWVFPGLTIFLGQYVGLTRAKFAQLQILKALRTALGEHKMCFRTLNTWRRCRSGNEGGSWTNRPGHNRSSVISISAHRKNSLFHWLVSRKES